ncbi:hypothetical protein PITC_074130 [Penicillium italicum]|uniref:SRR1-like domain-containing protein n=1 Tax=Penicillium italicum TaxID=40296 RepID=A0A0A2LEJ4_PENIT|nr:hypothetical protein PITC_074130 [Penicillium italicum]
MTALVSAPLTWVHQSNTSTGLVYPQGQPKMKTEQAIDLVKQMLESGQPFFTKKALQELGEQLRSLRTKGSKVTVKSLNGITFEGVVKLGHRYPSTTSADPVVREYINLEIAIEYKHPARLMIDLNMNDYGGEIFVNVLTPLLVTHEVYLFGKQEEVWAPKFAGDAFNKAREAWEKSEGRKRFEVTLSAAGGHRINKIVGFACGSLSRPGTPKAAFQHALLATAKKWLDGKMMAEQGDGKKSSCYMQDPQYTPVDREILNSIGFQQVDDPDGFLKVDEQSIVLSMAPNVPVKHIIADIARPAIVIWLKVEAVDTLMLDPDSSRIRQMMKEYDELKIGHDGDHFWNAKVYVRKTKDEPPFGGPWNKAPSAYIYTVNMGDTNNLEPVMGERISRLDLDYRYTRCRLAEPSEMPTQEEAKAIIDRLYASGVPFFTKDLIQDIWDQIKREPARGDKILTKDITGAVVECEVETGKVHQWLLDDDTKLEYVCKELVLNYQCRASLRRELDWKDYTFQHWEPCSVIIMHRTHEWDGETEQIIPRRGPVDREVVTKTFQDKIQEWKESPAYEKLKTILSSSAKNHEIDKVIGFALGTMSFQRFNEDGSLDTRGGWRSASQHALLLTMTEWLRERDHKEKVLCYSQDPAYSEVDRKILDEASIQVIEDPRGWLEVDEHSIVLSIAPNVPVKEIITDIARPAVIIWCRVGFDDGLVQGLTDPDSSRVRAMMEGYELHDFGPDADIFSDAMLYIRKSVAVPTPSSDGRFT